MHLKLLRPEGGGFVDEHASGYSEGSLYQMTGDTGTMRYMAPEVLKKKPYNLTADVYSFGIVLYFMQEGSPAFGDVTPESLQDMHVQGFRPKLNSTDKSRDVHRIIRDCWQVSYAQRPTFSELVRTLEGMLESIPAERGLLGCCSVAT